MSDKASATPAGLLAAWLGFSSACHSTLRNARARVRVLTGARDDHDRRSAASQRCVERTHYHIPGPRPALYPARRTGAHRAMMLSAVAVSAAVPRHLPHLSLQFGAGEVRWRGHRSASLFRYSYRPRHRRGGDHGDGADHPVPRAHPAASTATGRSPGGLGRCGCTWPFPASSSTSWQCHMFPFAGGPDGG